MAPIDLASFDIALVHFKLDSSRASSKKKTIRALYGPDRLQLSFVVPPCVVHWPRLHGDGDYGTRFGPTELAKAKYTACATDEPLPSGPNEPMRLWFSIVGAIERKLSEFVHAHRAELLSSRDISLEQVKGKLCASVKAKAYKGNAYEQQNLEARKYGYDGSEWPLRIVDAAASKPVDAPVEHRSICAFAVHLKSVYSGVAGSSYGCKWAIDEVCLISGPVRAVKAVHMALVVDWSSVEIP